MHLTERGEQIVGPLEFALAAVEDVLSQRVFDPETATRAINIAATDHIMALIASPLVSILGAEASNMRVQLLPAQPSSVRQLMVGEIDMIITPRVLMGVGITDAHTLASVNVESLMTEPLVCIGRADDVALAAGLLPEVYLARPHVGFSLDVKTYASVEQAQLAKLVVKQFDRMLVSSYAILAKIVEDTGCLSLVPLRLAQRAIKQHAIQMVTPPIPMPEMEWVMGWHKRNDYNPALLWIRAVLARCLAETEN